MPGEHQATRFITPEDVAAVPQPGLAQPVDFQFSPDDRLITFLYSPDRSRTRQLYAFDVAAGTRGLFLEPPSEGATDENVPLQEALRRERARQWGGGVTDYAWAEHAPRLLVPLPDGVYVQDDQGLRKVIEGGAQDCRNVARRQPNRVRAGRGPVGGSGRGRRAPSVDRGAQVQGVTRGLAEFVAAEEMDRHRGFWWSNDGSRIAFTEVDERHIPGLPDRTPGEGPGGRGRAGRPPLSFCRGGERAGAARRRRGCDGRDRLDERHGGRAEPGELRVPGEGEMAAVRPALGAGAGPPPAEPGLAALRS